MQELQEKPQELSAIFNLTIESFKQLQSYGIDLNHLFILECLSEGTDISKYISSTKIAAWKQNLIRKGFMTEEGNISTTGKELLNTLYNCKSVSLMIKGIKEKINESFERWWKTYPATNQFEYKGIKFSGNRGLRQRKSECELKFSTILNEGVYTVEDLIDALIHEITMKKEASIKSRENELMYMQNTLSYLNSRTFENFMNHSKNNESSSNNPHTMDI